MKPLRRRTVVVNSTPDTDTVAGCVALPKMDETDDPLLAGAVAAPVGSRINDKNGKSPGQEPKVIK